LELRCVRLADLFITFKFRRAKVRFLNKKNEFRDSMDALILFSRLYPSRSPQMHLVNKSVTYGFLKESLSLLLEGILDEKALHRVLRHRMETYYKASLKTSAKIKLVSQALFLASFPVVFWCVLSGHYANAGWTLLLATFLSSAVVAPVALHFKKKAQHEREMNEAIVHGLHLVSLKVNPIVVSEELNSFLPVDERIPWLAVALTAGKKAS
jgi:flagellar motor component MotA